MPVDVPLRTYDFCAGLRGRIWIWMFRGEDGSPTPVKGHLQIQGSTVNLTGIPAALRDEVALHGETFINKPEAAITSRNFRSPALKSWWKDASQDMRVAALRWLQSSASAAWTEAPELCQLLAMGDDSWILHPSCHLNDSVQLHYGEQVAFHGIVLPAGITSWDPMRGRGRHLKVTSIAGSRIDVRRDAPAPAANRLFVDSVAGERFAIPLLRALLHFGLVLVRKSDSHWQEWFEDFFQQSFRHDGYFRSAVNAHRTEIRNLISLRIADESGLYELTVDEARRRFGRWMPLDHGGSGVLLTNRNRLILFGHPTKRETSEIDLDTDTTGNFPW